VTAQFRSLPRQQHHRASPPTRNLPACTPLRSRTGTAELTAPRLQHQMKLEKPNVYTTDSIWGLNLQSSPTSPHAAVVTVDEQNLGCSGTAKKE